MSDQVKLDQLANDWGMTVPDLLEHYFLKSLVPGICMNDGCAYSTEYESDQRHGWCEACGTKTVTSALVLGGIT